MRNGHAGGDATRDGLSHGDGAAPDGLPRRAGDPRAGRARSPGPPPQQPAAHRHPANDQPPRGPGVPHRPGRYPARYRRRRRHRPHRNSPGRHRVLRATGPTGRPGSPTSPRSDPAAETADAADRTSPEEATAAEAPGRHRRRAAGRRRPAPRRRPGPSRRTRARAPARRSSFWKELPLLDRGGAGADLPDPDVPGQGLRHPVRFDGDDAARLRRLQQRPGARRQDQLPVSRTRLPATSSCSAARTAGAARSSSSSRPTRWSAACSCSGRWSGWRPPDEKDFVKRVIAVGGQTVQCCDSRQPGAGRRPAARPSPTSTTCPRPGRPGRTRSGRSWCPTGSCG